MQRNTKSETHNCHRRLLPNWTADSVLLHPFQCSNKGLLHRLLQRRIDRDPKLQWKVVQDSQSERRKLERKAEGQKKNTDRSSEGKQKGREIRKRKAKATVEWPWDEVTAYVSSRLPTLFLTDSRWGPANDEGTRFCVGDSYGRLALLLLDSTAERTLGIIPLGEVQPML